MLTSTAVLLSVLASLIQADLFAYDSQCDSGNDDANTAFATFDSNISDDGPLMWTIDMYADKDPSNSQMERFWRDFYLSTPTNLNLSDVTDFSGCGIYFYNVTAALQVEQDFSDYNEFSCSTVMNSQCQNDLRQQALDGLDLLSGVMQTNGTYYFSCEHLGERLAEREIPPSCSLGSQQPTWGYTRGSYIAGKDLTLWNVTGPGVRCTPNGDTLHNDLPAESAYISLPRGSEEAKAFQNGTTPVLTMFFNLPGQAQNASFLPRPEIHLTCLKTIPTKEEQTKINGGTRHAAASSFLLAVSAFVIGASLH